MLPAGLDSDFTKRLSSSIRCMCVEAPRGCASGPPVRWVGRLRCTARDERSRVAAGNLWTTGGAGRSGRGGRRDARLYARSARLPAGSRSAASPRTPSPMPTVPCPRPRATVAARVCSGRSGAGRGVQVVCPAPGVHVAGSPGQAAAPSARRLSVSVGWGLRRAMGATGARWTGLLVGWPGRAAPGRRRGPSE